jgi:hypothetical protein
MSRRRAPHDLSMRSPRAGGVTILRAARYFARLHVAVSQTPSRALFILAAVGWTSESEVHRPPADAGGLRYVLSTLPL